MATVHEGTRSSKQLGDLGEAILCKWAREEDFVVNDSNEDDRAGWDFLVELPPAKSHSVARTAPYHEEMYPLKAFVQVKATDGEPGSRPIKLSNRERHLGRSEPVFFLVLEMGGKNDPEAAYLVHVGEELIRRALRRKHKNWIGDRKPLNKLKMMFSYGPDDRLSSHSGQALKEGLMAPIIEAGTAAAYNQWKEHLVHTAGFEGGNYAIRVVPDEDIAEDDPQIVISDFQVGLRKKIPYSQAEFYPARFGLRTDEPSHRFGSGNIEAPEREPLAQVQIDVSAPGLPRRSSLEADLYASDALWQALKSNDNPERFPMRFSTPFFEIAARVGPSNGSRSRASGEFSLPEKDERHPIDELRRFAGLILILVDAAERGTHAEVKVSKDGNALLSFAVEPERVSELGLADFVPVSHAFETAWELSKAFDVPQEEMSMEDLEENLEINRMLAAVSRGEARGREVSFDVSPNPGLDLTEEMSGIPKSETPIIWLCETSLGSHILVAAVAFVGELEITPNEDGSHHYSLLTEKAHFIVKRAVLDRSSIHETPRELIQMAARELGRPYLALTGHDLIG